MNKLPASTRQFAEESGTRETYVINLDRSTERWRQFKEWNGHLDARRFPATNGASLDREELFRPAIRRRALHLK